MFAILVITAGIVAPAAGQARYFGIKEDTTRTRTIIYFSPVQSDLDVAYGKDLDEALDDFAYYISRADSTMKKLGIKTVYNTSTVIEVPYGEAQRITVDRRVQSFGYIFTDGKKRPLVIDYVLTDLDLIETAKDYFGIK
jgi:hypothetical protein